MYTRVLYNKESYDEAAPLGRFARAVPAFVLTAHCISGCTALFCGKYPNQKLETRIEKCKFAKGSSKRQLFTTNETSKRQKQPNCHRFPAHDRHTDTDIHFQSSPLMQHFTRTLFALALSLGTFTAAFAGDGTKKAPYTPYELAAASDSLSKVEKPEVYVKGNLLGFGANPAKPQDFPEEALNIILDGEKYRVTVEVGELVLSLYNVEQREDYVVKVVGVEDVEGQYKYTGTEVSGAYSLTIGENHLAAFGLNSNFRVENAAGLAYATASINEEKEGDFDYHVYTVADSVITGSGKGYIFGGKPGTYPITLTLAKGSTPEDGNVLSIAGEAGETSALPGEQLFKWESTAAGAGLRLGNNDGQTLELTHSTDVYARVEEAKVNLLFGDKADRSFLPWTNKKVTGLFAPKMRTAAARLGVYDLSGRKVADGTDTNGLPQGLYIVGGRKVFVR